MKGYIMLIRPHQWVKNLFIFLPVFFGGHLLEWHYMVPALITFAAYCFVAGSIYCFNDIHDREADRQHPKKRLRPVASGRVSVRSGYVLMAVMLLSAMAVIFQLPAGDRLKVSAVIFCYYAMNIAYCVRLKRIALVDVFVIATGFVLRIVVGGLATHIALSHWIVLMTFLLALFLALAKRRDDVVIYEETGVKPRSNILRYNLSFLNQAISIIASVTMVCYIMYTVSEEVISRMGSNLLYATSVFVLAGIMRYLQLTIVDAKSGSPTRILLKDRFMQGCIFGWIISFCMILYI